MTQRAPFPFITPGSYDHFLKTTEPFTPEIIDQFLSTVNIQPDIKALDIYPLMETASSIMWRRQYDMLEYFLEKFPFEQANTMAITTVLRSISAANFTILPSYMAALKRGYDRIDELNEDPDQKLRGIDYQLSPDVRKTFKQLLGYE